MFFFKQQKIFLLCFLFLLAISIFQLYPFLIDGAVWAEEITNFFHYTYVDNNIFRVAKQTDAGYLPLFPRIISLVTRMLRIPYEWVSYFYAWTYVIVACLLLGWFCNSKFRILIKSDYLRFFLVISIWLLYNVETRTFINIAYLLYFFVFYQILYFITNKADFDWTMVFVPIVLVSKTHLLVFFPVLLYLLFCTSNKIRVVVGISVLLLVLQIITILLQATSGTMSHYLAMNVSIIQKLCDTIIFEIQYIASFFFPYIKEKLFLYILGICINLFIIITFTLFLRNKSLCISIKKQIIVSFLIVLFAFVFVCFASYGRVFNTDVHLYGNSRIFATLNISIIVFLFLLVNTLKNIKIYSVAVFFLFVSIICQIYSTSSFSYNYISDWKNEANELNNEEFFINLDPFPWSYARGKKMTYNNLTNFSGYTLPLVLATENSYKREVIIDDIAVVDNIQYIGFMFKGKLNKELKCVLKYQNDILFSGISSRINSLSSVGMIKLKFMGDFYSNSTNINLFKDNLNLECNQKIDFFPAKKDKTRFGMFFISSNSNHSSYISNRNEHKSFYPYGFIQGTNVCDNLNLENGYPRGIELFLATYKKNFTKMGDQKQIFLKIYNSKNQLLDIATKNLNEIKDNTYVYFAFNKAIPKGSYKICMDASMLENEDSLTFYTQNGTSFIYNLY